jgi:hypothetical protein
MQFTRISKLTFTISVALLQGGPREESAFRNVVPGASGRRGEAKFRRGSPGFGRGRVGRRSRAYWGSVWALGRGGGGAGEQVRRRPGTAAVADAVPASGGSGRGCGRLGGLV